MQVKHSLTACVAGALGLAVSGGAIAQGTQSNTPQDKRVYIAPMVSYGFFGHDHINDNKFENDDSVGGKLAIGKPINNWLNLEAFGFYFNPDVKENGHKQGDADLYGFGLDALFFPARDTFPVYGILGASWGQESGDLGHNGEHGSADGRFLDAGVGYMYTLNDYGMKVRAEYRYRHATLDTADTRGQKTRTNDNILSLGLQIPLGAPPQAEQPTQAPAPTQPQDSDGDGVIDANDQCPGTPAGTEVDAHGCPIEKTAPIVLKGVTFAFDSSELDSQAQDRLENVVDALDASPDVDFRIDGYTDSIGTKKYNRGLSQRRVNSVEGYLSDHGVSDTRISGAEGHGESNPVATNKTKAGRAQNRRVELHVTNQDDE